MRCLAAARLKNAGFPEIRRRSSLIADDAQPHMTKLLSYSPLWVRPKAGSPIP
jgi:hypothetical protein